MFSVTFSLFLSWPQRSVVSFPAKTILLPIWFHWSNRNVHSPSLRQASWYRSSSSWRPRNSASDRNFQRAPLGRGRSRSFTWSSWRGVCRGIRLRSGSPWQPSPAQTSSYSSWKFSCTFFLAAYSFISSWCPYSWSVRISTTTSLSSIYESPSKSSASHVSPSPSLRQWISHAPSAPLSSPSWRPSSSLFWLHEASCSSGACEWNH